MPRKKKGAEPGAAKKGTDPKQADSTHTGLNLLLSGQLASEIPVVDQKWFLRPWIPTGTLTLVVGNPAVGKSSFLAALAAYATGAPIFDGAPRRKPGRVVLMPGHEEDVKVMTVPRLAAAGCKLDRVKILDKPGIGLVRDRDRLMAVCENFGADLLIGDPIDSYTDKELKENDSASVRELLEAAHWIGEKAGCAVVFARHPGKDPNNILPGSRQWRTVPRSVVQMTTDGNWPPSFAMSLNKDSCGTKGPPQRYVLQEQGKGPPLFQFANILDRSAQEVANTNGGPVGRWKLLQACRLIRWIWEVEDSPTRVALGEEARKQGIGEDTVHEALRLLGIRSLPPAERGTPWKLCRTAEKWPDWLLAPVSPSDTPEISGQVGKA